MTMPWERLADEPDDAFKQFTYYLHMAPPRRVLGVLHGPTVSKAGWAQTWSWYSRAKAWDDHLAKVAAEEAEETIKESVRAVTQHHMRILQGLREVLEREAGKWLEESRTASGQTLLKPREIMKLTDVVVKLDRLVREQSTENIDVPTDLSSLSLEDLRTMQDIQKKLT